MLGFGNPSWGGASLPLLLDAFGMPGCVAHISPDVFAVTPAAGFESTMSFPIPNDPQLVGIVLDVQALVVDPGINPIGASISNALRLGVGQ